MNISERRELKIILKHVKTELIRTKIIRTFTVRRENNYDNDNGVIKI